LHMRVKFVIAKELGGDYGPQVSACGVGSCGVTGALTTVFLLPGALVGHGRVIG
jgi:hypothetical protein